MLITIASYAATAVLPFAAYMGYLRYINRNIPKVLAALPAVENEVEVELPATGLTVIDYVIPAETEEEFLRRLKHIHSEAWQTYQSDYKNKKILDDSDRFVNMLILKYRNGEVDMECRQHTMNFTDGTEIWIANKWYSYGNVYRCKRSGITFDYSDGRLSPYTFMSIVDLEMEKTNFYEWKKYHDDYSRRRLKGLKTLLRM